MRCHGPEPLYVILPYFNYCKFHRRRELFVKFVNEIHKVPGLKLIVSECRGLAPLPSLPVWKHLRVSTDDHLWLKENLINLGAKLLPRNWKYVAWIDADIEFLNKNWVQETIEELQTADVVQLFQTCVNLGPNGEAVKTDKSFGYMAKGSGTPWVPTDKYGFWHPGYAWACTRRAWGKMGGLIDWAILGSGDRHMAMALIGKILDSCHGSVHDNYKALLRKFQCNVKGLKLSWVEGTIVHFWHGSFENRRYKERWDILVKNNFDPFLDIGVDSDGQMHLSTTGRRLEPHLIKYFLGRAEDS